jgi:hypothetical protein
MAIKPEADQLYFQNRPEERRLALALDEAFDVTFGKSYGQLAFWLAEPKNQPRERFGLHQEVLIVYSPHARTDARVLTAIENITRIPDFKNRVERVLFVVVHSGDSEAVQQLLALQTERVIVPFHANELLRPKRGPFFVRARIAKVLGEIDLFGMSSPIRSDKYFFGRDETVQALVSRAASRHENSGLFGLRKTGKTSVLFAVQRRLSDHPVLVEYLDCQNPGVHAVRWWQVLENLVVRLNDALRRRSGQGTDIHRDYSPSTAGAFFASDVASILKAGSLAGILIMLDEVEYITHGLSGALGKHWDEDFVPLWQTIRATHHETGGQLCFIVAGVNPACVEKSHFGVTPNPIFQLAVPQYLEPLNVEAVKAMVRSIGRYAGLTFDEEVYSYLQDKYGGHPYLIRIACSEVWKTCETTDPDRLAAVSRSTFSVLAASIRSRLAQPIKDILLSLVWWYPDEYEALQIFAAGDRQFLADYLQEHPASVLQFARYGILSGQSQSFAIADLKDFLVEQGDAYKKEISPFTRGDMPPSLLPEIPDLEALGKLFALRSEIEIGLRKAVMLYLGVRFNWNPTKIAKAMSKGLRKRPDRPNPEELLVGRAPQEVVNDLYVPDLKQIVLENWDVFGGLFDDRKERFAMNMDTLNLARRVDAHTKPITEAERVDFDNSYAWLKRRLSRLPS